MISDLFFHSANIVSQGVMSAVVVQLHFARMIDESVYWLAVCVHVQSLTGLMCEHQFCRDCWREYLTIKIMDEGVCQVRQD